MRDLIKKNFILDGIFVHALFATYYQLFLG